MLAEPKLNYERIMAYRPADILVSYGERECILYALGIGIGMDPLDTGELKFVYERAGLQAFPTMAVVLGWPGRMTDPAFGIDERLVVAGDLKVVLHRPLAPQATLVSRPRVKEVIDKGPGNAAIIQNTRELIGEDGAPVATVDSSTFARKHGGFGGKAQETPAPHAVPQSAPAAICRRRPILRSCIASTAMRIRCMPIRSAPRPRASSAPFCTGRRASGSRRARSCAPAPITGRSD
jgi:MFE-2 hydratase 2 N-terminal domain